eukprot:6175622-Amphidinium_carterae.1
MMMMMMRMMMIMMTTMMMMMTMMMMTIEYNARFTMPGVSSYWHEHVNPCVRLCVSMCASRKGRRPVL